MRCRTLKRGIYALRLPSLGRLEDKSIHDNILKEYYTEHSVDLGWILSQGLRPILRAIDRPSGSIAISGKECVQYQQMGSSKGEACILYMLVCLASVALLLAHTAGAQQPSEPSDVCMQTPGVTGPCRCADSP